MAIRRVTGAVSPSELIFADANALGATYDGSGTTIERGETFTLPAGGTTAVSNGALRLEALKGDCTITNNGNSTLTNASGVDGTIVMRSGASDFPAFVRNSSLGSMSTPVREDFTGDITGATGTFDGTIGSNATVPASVGSSMILVKAHTSTGLLSSGTNFQDLFNSTYQDYVVYVQCSSLTNYGSQNISFSFINSSGTATYGSGYKYTCYGNDATGTERRLNSNGTDQGVVFNGIRGNSSNQGGYAVIHFHHPHTSNKITFWHGQGSYPREGTVGVISSEFGGIFETNILATGLQWFTTTTAATADLAIQSYAIKKS